MSRSLTTTATSTASAKRGAQQGIFVVAVGASAGGLEACTRLVEAVPHGTVMSFILVQHLEPTHKSMMVDLLTSHTAMTVSEAIDGDRIEAGHCYTIPPGTYLSVVRGRLKLSPPALRHGARMPFDFLLNSLASEAGVRAACIVLSGTGSDGSIGLKAIKAAGGLVIAQDPDEASYDGMPQSAIDTGAVDHVLKIAKMPAALASFQAESSGARHGAAHSGPDPLAAIVALVRGGTSHDFSHYKPGTIARRIDRRMAMLGIPAGGQRRYLEVLRKDAGETEQLARDLLINVTSFFRDDRVFAELMKSVVPALVRDQPAGQPLRIWIAGCSTGEEAYSIAILFHEEIARSKRSIKLQIFASDLDEEAVATAREGSYPAAISADVSAARLARFFVDCDGRYAVTPALRSDVVFTVQNVLADPPFSRLDLISCRNLLIYLDAEAQQKVISLFSFALRDDGVLLLGNAETIGHAEASFAVVSKSDRIYRRVARVDRKRVSALAPTVVRAAPDTGKITPTASRHSVLAELCRRLVVDAHAPAAVLINRRFECLFSVGPTERYLRVAPGHPTHDILAMAQPTLRARLRTAIEQVGPKALDHVVTGCRTTHDGHILHYSLDIRSVMSGGEELLLIAFIDVPGSAVEAGPPEGLRRTSRAHRLEGELATLRGELETAMHSLEVSEEEHKATSEEASSVNEEFQSTNEELLTSKEELQSLNEQLTALNTQLQETLERQRTTSDDLQNILYSTDVATLFLDRELNIRFFTPATKALFNVIPGDIGRPLADLHSLASDLHLPDDARAVLKTGEAIEREIETLDSHWCRRILPYRVHGGGIEGVVITFDDITGRLLVAKALEAAKQQAELANRAKSRFLAAASHDLRQPLQTLKLLEGLLEKSVEGDQPKKLLARFGQTLSTMAQMLDTLLDINQIEAGTVHAEIVNFPLDRLLDTLRNDFTLHAQAKQLDLRVVPCGEWIDSDPRLLEQMLRNLLTNAIKYTRSGRVLLGCRHRAGRLSIQVWDTGIGIPGDDLDAIFEEYRQVDANAGDPDHGLGLGLSIVRRLGELLGHRIDVASEVGCGSMFSIDVIHVPVAHACSAGLLNPSPPHAGQIGSGGTIFVIEDDDSVRDTNELVLNDAGYATIAVPDGAAALHAARRHSAGPDLILSDFNLPNGMDGLAVTAALRSYYQKDVPAIILTGDITTAALREIAAMDCIHLSKPVKLGEMLTAIQAAMVAQPQSAEVAVAPLSIDTSNHPVIFVVDDDAAIRTLLRAVLESEGLAVEDFADAETFLAAYRPGREACLLVDAYLPGLSGLDLLRVLGDGGHRLPSVMITGHSDVAMAVLAMKAGALDFIEKPVGVAELLVSISRALAQSRDAGKLYAWRQEAADHVALLTDRQHEIMDLIVAGHPNKNIAADLGISQRTVENHRAAIMRKTGSKSVPALARLALSAAAVGAGGLLIAGSPPVIATPAR